MIIAIDFDGTCVTHEFPKVGREIGAAPVLRELVKNGHQLVLFTMRSNVENPQVFGKDKDHLLDNVPSGNYLDDAVNWFKENGIELYGIQSNPTQHTWTTSPKAYAQLYIDDAALGCPLRHSVTVSNRPFVDWVEVTKMLKLYGILP